jgi:tetratricopeptide (TPR) repeat protein
MHSLDSRNAGKHETNARKFTEHALKLDPTLFDGMLLMADINVTAGDYDLARTWADRAESRRPGDLEVKATRANIAMREHDFRTAVAEARDVAANAKETYVREEGDFVLYTIYANQGFNQQAEATLQEMVKLSPGKAIVHDLYAGFLLHQNRVDDAITEAERAGGLSNDSLTNRVLATVYAAKADALWSSHANGDAVHYVDKAMPFMGDDADSYYSAGNFYARAADKLGKPELKERAVAAYKKALEIMPDHANARRALERMTQDRPVH